MAYKMIFAINSASAYYKLICHDNIITVTERRR